MSVHKVRVAASQDVVEGKLLRAKAGETMVLLSRVKGRVHAVVDRCPHLGMSLAKGKVEDGTVSCPWHNSKFDLCTGRNIDWVNAFLGTPLPQWTRVLVAMGKEPAPLQTLPVEERGSEVFVKV
jgi:nitrite reductase/ring-hydroxylating ferredoxin subunit